MSSSASSPCTEVAGFRHVHSVISNPLRSFPIPPWTSGKGIDIYLPPYGSPLRAPPSAPPVSAPSHSNDGSVSMCSPLRSKHSLSTAQFNKEQANTALRCGFGLHVGRNTARGRVCRVPSRNQGRHHRAPAPAYSAKSKRGKASRPIGRTGGLPTEKGEIFPFNPL